MRTYATGDIHGRADRLTEMHRLIDLDLRSYTGDSTVIYLGDYVDRGSNTKGVLEQLISSTVGTSRVFLKGNHEDLEFLAHPKKAQRWLAMGGTEAAQSYGVAENDPRRVATGLAAAMPCTHMHFLRNLEVSHSTDLYFLCHAGVCPGIALAKQEAHDMMWIKGDFLNSAKSLKRSWSTATRPWTRWTFGQTGSTSIRVPTQPGGYRASSSMAIRFEYWRRKPSFPFGFDYELGSWLD